jgi:tRNA(fMet)-specific endonuclease VapC
MPRFMPDANVIIDVIRRLSSSVTERFAILQPGEAVISVVVYGELLLGVEKSAKRAHDALVTQAILQDMAILPLSAYCASTYAHLRAGLERSAQMIRANDLWIAAHAIAEDLTLVTSNEREFRRVPGLKFENWTK